MLFNIAMYIILLYELNIYNMILYMFNSYNKIIYIAIHLTNYIMCDIYDLLITGCYILQS